MGTTLNQGETKFRISFAAVPFALAALKEWAGKAERIMWAAPQKIVDAPSLDGAIGELGWSVVPDADGNIISVAFDGEKLGSEDEWMTAIGPHVDAGSYIEHEVDGIHYRWYFDGEKCVSQKGRVVFDDPADTRTAAMESFIDTIESTGGVTRNAKGLYEPGGDPGWIDLGDSYIAACKALGREPKIVIEDDDDEKVGRILTVTAAGKPSHLDDASVPGDYHVGVPDEFDDARAASCALDVFHNNVAVKVLDDFTFTVQYGDLVLTPGDGAAYADKDAGEFMGRA